MLRQALALCFVLAALQCSAASAAGPFSRMRSSVQRSSSTYAAPGYRAAPYANRAYGGNTAGASRYRLPAGRSYYQGRYYGQLNNRFYGPQYGYF